MTPEYYWTEKGGGYLKPVLPGVEDGRRYVQEWPMGTELCSTCQQPDNCGDCNHAPLTHTQVEMLGGWFTALDTVLDKKWIGASL